VVLRDNEVVATLTDVAPGAMMEFEDVDVPRYDVFHYAVYVVANGRVGKHANVMKVMVGPSCNWRVIMTSNDAQGWKGGTLTVCTATGREITRMTTTTSAAVQIEPELPLGRLSFVWTAPEETVSQMAFVIKNSSGETVYSYSGSSDDLSSGVFFETNNGCGNEMICDTPENLVATAQGDAILLTWDAVEHAGYGYQIYRDDLLYRLIPSGNAFLDEAVAMGGHCYRVGVLCEGGENGEYSNESCATAGPCYPPRNLDFEYTNNYKVKLNWEAPQPNDGLSGYYLFRKEGEGEYHRIKVLNATAVTFTDNSLSEEGDYYYRLYAYYRDWDCTSSPANRKYYPNEFELHAYYSSTGMDETEAQVKVYPNPVTYDNHTVVLNDVSSSKDRQWLFGDQTDTSRICSFVYPIPDDSVLVLFSAHDRYGCTDSVTIVVYSDLSNFWVPNAFTPDESTNDRFFVKSFDITSGVVNVFSRDGLSVCSFDALTGSWDGTKNGSPCPQGTYVWKLTYTSRRNPDIYKQAVGTVTLLR
jgi:gliding motility-associated-like protein